MSKPTGAALEHETSQSLIRSRPVELFATVGLALSTLVAVMAVSIGIARADVLGVRADADAAPFAIALLVGLLFAAMGGLTAVMAEDGVRRD
ncbi:MAG: hypothetical protein QOG83_858 [Alphaproteobacteria bacterium]|jgi:glycerol uptake facilitator-like aquaporin|nr:hypothetical protein [Alphaproteobacteria bacterium]MEA2988147.1 hypothetical protein [Alphaproteobacteria bacterium]